MENSIGTITSYKTNGKKAKIDKVFKQKSVITIDPKAVKRVTDIYQSKKTKN